MSTSLSDIIDNIHPGVNAAGTFLADTAWIVFDREMDEKSILENFFIEGPDTDSVQGPSISLNLPQISSSGGNNDQLQSAGYKGIVPGTITFQRINLTDLDEYTSSDDTAGDGTLWRTKAIFTPTDRLQTLTKYTVYLSGDEDTEDSSSTGILSRTVFDAVSTVFVDGVALAVGSYTGTQATDRYIVTITTNGARGTAKFSWAKDSDVTIHGPFLCEEFQNTPLDSGVEMIWGTGTFTAGDTFAVNVKQPEVFSGNMYWDFTTGSGSIIEVPSEASTSAIGTIASFKQVNEVEIFSTNPDSQSTNLDPSITSIGVTFNVPVDQNSIVVSVTSEPVNGDESIVSGITWSPTLIHSEVLSNDGLNLLITLNPGQLFNDNLVTITLEKGIASLANSLILANDFTFWFTTKYSPLYSSIRKVRLDIGSYIKDMLDDTINLAIYEASLGADELSWAGVNSQNKFYAWAKREWVTCKASQILLMNIIGLGGLRSKKLDNLEVSYDLMKAQDLLDKTYRCLERWELELKSAGQAVQKVTSVVKGELDLDDPHVGRLWEKGPFTRQVAGSNLRYRPFASRRYIGGYRPSNSRWRGRYS